VGLGSEDAIEKISKIASELTGVQLGERQRSMVETRLTRRVSQLKLKNLDEYHQYLMKNFDLESRALISLLTTHHTFFFREFLHFKYIEDHALPKLIEVARSRPDKTIHIWSAASSRGQEVYSLAMFFSKLLKERAPDVKYKILGSDVDIESVNWAKNGVYHKNEIKEVPLPYLADNWARGKGNISDFVKVKDSLKAHCHFEDRNILKLSPTQESKHYDLIFCRNVLIYFNSEQIKTVINSLMQRLHPDGHLVVGVSESLLGLGLDIESKGSSIYTHKKAVAEPKVDRAPEIKPAPVLAPVSSKPLRVLCVDDSKSILVLLSKILTKDKGFEIVGTAMSGLEAKEQVEKLKPDVVTLDIHMPQQTGVEYLKANMSKNHPPVVMISSVSREDGDLAIKALEYGASDYVEKPTLQTFPQKSDEIQLKLRSAVENSKSSLSSISTFDQSFRRPSGQPTRKDEICAIVCGMGEIKKAEKILKELKSLNWSVTTMLLIEGAPGVLPKMAEKLSQSTGASIQVMKVDPEVIPGPGYFGIGDFHESIHSFTDLRKNRPLAIWVLGGLSKSSQGQLAEFKNAQILLEDRSPSIWKSEDPLMKVATDVMPWNSYVYMTGEYFKKVG